MVLRVVADPPPLDDATVRPVGDATTGPPSTPVVRSRRGPWVLSVAVVAATVVVVAVVVAVVGRATGPGGDGGDAGMPSRSTAAGPLTTGPIASTSTAPTAPPTPTAIVGSVAASTTTVVPTGEVALGEVAAGEVGLAPRPDGLIPVDDPSLRWPFGEPGGCLVQMVDLDELQPVECERPHDLQRFVVAELDTFSADAGYDARAVSAAVDAACRAAFEPFVGVVADESMFDVPYTLPSEATWAEGDRRYQCLVGVAGSRVVGDATGVGR
jgi:hypothetical protein